MGKMFIGRAAELRELKTGLADALSGHGCLIMVAGEAGIGKTRLTEELAGEATQRGGLVLWGRCWEGGGAPAYWPWLQIIRGYIRTHDRDLVAAQLGEGTRDLSQIVPELRDLVPDVPAVVPLDPDDASFRLFDAHATLFKNIAAVQPLVLIIDDLHDGDPASLRLLRFIVRELRAAPILVIATYREVEARQTPAIRELVGALVRGSRGLALRGLTPAEVRQLVEQSRPIAEGQAAPISEALVAAIHVAADGNPFFIDAIVRALLLEGALEDSGGAAALERLRIPDQAREMLRQRLHLLPAAVIDILHIGAVIGREFDSRVIELMGREGSIAPVEGLGVSLLDVLSPAVESGVLTPAPDVPGRYSFTHPLMRKTVYDDISPPHRIQLHRAIGEALAKLNLTRADANVESIAHHFYQAAAHGCALQAVDYAVQAAERATAMLAYDEAVRHWEHAIEALEIGGEDATPQQPLELRRCELLQGLGTALNNGGERRRAKEVLARAAASARKSGAAEQLAHVALAFGGGWLGFAEMAKMEEPGAVGTDETLSGLVTDALHALGETCSPVRARLLSLLAREGYFTLPMVERESLCRQAMDVARRSGDFATLAEVLIETHVAMLGPDTMQERLDMAREALRLAQMTGQLHLEGEARFECVVNLLDLGDSAAFEREAAAYTRFAERTRLIAAVWADKVRAAMQALLTGRFDDAEWLAGDALQAGKRADLGATIAYNVQLSALRREQGRLAELAGGVGMWKAMVAQHPRVTALRAGLAFFYAETGDVAEARAELEHLARYDFVDLARDQAFLLSLTQLTEVCLAVEQAAHARSLYALLLPYAQYNATDIYGAVCWGSVSRSLGLLATMLGRWEDAERHFELALERNRAFGARPWIAHTQVSYAAMLLRRATGDDEARALQLLQHARDAAEVLKMTLLAERIRTLLATAGAHERVERQDAARQPVPEVGPQVAAEVISERNQFHKNGEYWTIAYGAVTFRLKHSRGLTFLSALLREPGREIAATDLAVSGEPNGGGENVVSLRAALGSRQSGVSTGGLGDAGALLDAQARVDYKQRLVALREQLAEAEGFNDSGRSARIREEIDFLAAELSRAVGFGGHTRRAGSHAERARVNVTRAISLALAKITESHPSLGAHFARTIKTGTFCSYSPDPRAPIQWEA